MILCLSFNKRVTHFCWWWWVLRFLPQEHWAPHGSGCWAPGCCPKGPTPSIAAALGSQRQLLHTWQEQLSRFHAPLFDQGLGDLKHPGPGITDWPASKSTGVRFLSPAPCLLLLQILAHPEAGISAWHPSGLPSYVPGNIPLQAYWTCDYKGVCVCLISPTRL